MTDTEKKVLEQENENEEEKDEEENIDWEQRAVDAEEKLNKTEKNFRNMAKRYNDLKANSKYQEWFDPEALNELVNIKVSEAQFYSTNSLASDHKKEIQEIQSQYPWMNAEDALNLYLSKTNPEVLTRLKSESSVGVDGVDKRIVNDNPSVEDINKMTDSEFDEYRKNRGK